MADSFQAGCTSSYTERMSLVLVTAMVLAIDLPTAAAANPALRQLNPHRARVTVSADAILVRAKRGDTEKKVVTLKQWVPAPADLDGKKIVALAAALAPPKPAADEELPERFFSSEVDGWVELYVDRGAPWDLVVSVMYTASEQASTFGCALKTPDGERLLVIVPQDVADQTPADVLTLGLDAKTLMVAGDGAPPKAKRTVEAVRSVVTAFATKKSKGRAALIPGALAPFCPDGKSGSAPVEKCWRGRVVFAAAAEVSWGDALPFAAAAAEKVPWVVFASF